jgi:hypothetical protein
MIFEMKFWDNELRMMKDNEDYKSEIQDEIYELCSLLQAQQMSTNSAVPIANSIDSSPMPVPSSTPVGVIPSLSINTLLVNQHTPPTSLVSQVNDIHSQMMLMMTESFSKLSTVLVESKHDSKSE